MVKHKNFPFELLEKDPVNLKEEDFNSKESGNIKHKRPTIITVICGYFFISWGLKLVLMLRLLGKANNISLNFTSFGSLEGFVSFLVSTLTIISIFGIWFIKKWGVYLYTAVNIFTFVYLLLQFDSKGYLSWDTFSSMLWGLVLPIFVIVIGFLNLKRMN